jgi:hypothetical protein
VVKLDGEPLVGAVVTFQPIAQHNNPNPGPVSVGVTDDDGRYTLHLQLTGREREGAVLGHHRVHIVVYEGGTPKKTDDVKPKVPRQLLPPKFNSASELTYHVVGGTKSADFALSSR